MSMPQTENAKGRHRSSRRTKNTSASVSDGDQPVSDSGPSPDAASIPATPGSQLEVDHQTQRKKPPGPKKSHNTPRADRAPNQRHASPQPNPSHPSQRQGTPVKQAYAGPTFHSSPAPSALPLPSFYSKSMPSIPSATTPNVAEEVEAHDVMDRQPEPGTDGPIENERKRESTPLDFLFEAARQARDTPRAESPTSRSANLSTLEDSPLSCSPAPREGGDTVFPFELEGTGSSMNNIGPAFATPYKERMTALRSSSASPSTTAPDLDDEDRKTKTEALKKLLMINAQTSLQHHHSALPNGADANNPFNARAPELQNRHSPSRQTRHHSKPSTPIPALNVLESQQYFPGPPGTAQEARTTGSPLPPIHRPASSHLRYQYQVQPEDRPVELASDTSVVAPPIPTARKPVQHRQSPYHSNKNNNNNNNNNNNSSTSTSTSTALPRTDPTSAHRPSRSAQQLEDDLRRVLKLDLTSRG